MSIRNWVNVVIGALLLLTAASTCGYERGKSVGNSEALIAKDDSLRQVDRDLIAIQTHRADSVSVLAKEALMERDTALVKLERAQARRDTSRSFALAERTRFTLNGDTASVNGISYVLPKTVATYVRFSDTAFSKQGELDAETAHVDTNSAKTIARLLNLSATKDTVISLQGSLITQDEREIADLKAMKTPRFTVVHGLVAGIVIAASLLHFVK